MMIEPLNLSPVRETFELLIFGAVRKARHGAFHRSHVVPGGRLMPVCVAAVNRSNHGRAAMATAAKRR